PCIIYLPTYTAIAWYYKKLPPDLQGGDVQKAVEESRKFAVGEYADALMTGDALPSARRAEIMQKVARLTGLSPDYIDRTNLRIEIQRFTKELLRSERRTIGRIDARFTGIDRDAAGEHPEFDPSIAAIIGPYSGMLNDYVRNDLKFDSNLPYEVLTGRVRPWNYAPYENRYVNVAETLRGAMTQNPFLHVFVAKGYYDLATPFFAADYTFDHLSLDPTLRGHLSGAYYEAGHMMYVHPPSRPPKFSPSTTPAPRPASAMTTAATSCPPTNGFSSATISPQSPGLGRSSDRRSPRSLAICRERSG